MFLLKKTSIMRLLAVYFLFSFFSPTSANANPNDRDTCAKMFEIKNRQDFLRNLSGDISKNLSYFVSEQGESIAILKLVEEQGIDNIQSIWAQLSQHKIANSLQEIVTLKFPIEEIRNQSKRNRALVALPIATFPMFALLGTDIYLLANMNTGFGFVVGNAVAGTVSLGWLANLLLNLEMAGIQDNYITAEDKKVRMKAIQNIEKYIQTNSTSSTVTASIPKIWVTVGDLIPQQLISDKKYARTDLVNFIANNSNPKLSSFGQIYQSNLNLPIKIDFFNTYRSPVYGISIQKMDASLEEDIRRLQDFFELHYSTSSIKKELGILKDTPVFAVYGDNSQTVIALIQILKDNKENAIHVRFLPKDIFLDSNESKMLLNNVLLTMGFSASETNRVVENYEAFSMTNNDPTVQEKLIQLAKEISQKN